MTVLRREDVQSRGASWDQGPCRIASSPILAIVPLIIRRLRGPSPSRVTMPSPLCLSARLAHRRRRWLERRPEEARQLARNRDGDLRRGLVLFRQAPEASTQSLLRLVRDRDHTTGLSLPPPCEGDANAWPVLIMPRGLHQQPADQRVAGPGDASASMFLTRGILTRHEAEIG